MAKINCSICSIINCIIQILPSYIIIKVFWSDMISDRITPNIGDLIFMYWDFRFWFSRIRQQFNTFINMVKPLSELDTSDFLDSILMWLIHKKCRAGPVIAHKNTFLSSNIQFGFVLYICITHCTKYVHVEQIGFDTCQTLIRSFTCSMVVASVAYMCWRQDCIHPQLFR